MSPASLSIDVVCTIAISCPPRVLRTMSSPLESDAYRKVRSFSLGNGDRIVATSDFSGLVSSDWALARALAMAPIDSLERCMFRLHLKEVETDGACPRPLGPDAVPDRLLGILGHERFQFSLSVLVLEERRPSLPK